MPLEVLCMEHIFKFLCMELIYASRSSMYGTYIQVSTDHFERKRPRRQEKKSRFAYSTDEITATMKSLWETLAATAPPQMPQLTDPHAVLWQKLEAIPLTPVQRVLIGEHLSTKENKG